MKIDSSSEHFFYYQLGVLLSLCSLILITLSRLKKSEVVEREDFEKKSLDLIKNNFFKKNPLENCSESYFIQFERLKSNFERESRLGEVFKETIPFEVLFLDSNLKILWASNIILDFLNIDISNQDVILTEDIISSFTDMRNHDPAFEAIRDKMIGIYNINFKKGNEKIPYEMHISQSEIQDQSRIMLYFYPLKSFEDSINYQSQLVERPVEEALNMLIQNDWNSEDLRQLFKTGGVERLFDKFEEIHKIHLDQKVQFIEDIKTFKKELSQSRENELSLKNDLTLIGSLFDRSVKKLIEVKTSIVDVISLREFGEVKQKDLLKVSEVLLEKNNFLFKTLSENVGILLKSTNSFQAIREKRAELKEINGRLKDTRNDVSRALEQLIVLAKIENPGSKIDLALHDLKEDVKVFTSHLNSFSSQIKTLDVVYSKVEQSFANNKEINFNSLKADLEKSQSEVIERGNEIEEGIGKSAQIDKKLIDNLKEFYSYIKDIKRVPRKHSSQNSQPHI